MAAPGNASRFSFGRFLLYVVLVVLALGALYVAVVYNWSYSSGERAGWVQKFSKKGWFCKTWEGEIALVSMPGAIPEKFEFTVLDDEVAEQINRHMGRRVALHYEQKVGLPTTCFGETRYYVTRVSRVDEMPAAPGGPAPGIPGQGSDAPPTAPQSGPAPSAPSLPAPPPAPAPAQAPAPTPTPSTAPAESTPGLPASPAPARP